MSHPEQHGSEPQGTIFEIQRWSGNDGPGIRTVVFFKGCPLRCEWCCNPESWSPLPQVAFFAHRCQDCGLCRAACPQSIAAPGAGPTSGCTACGRCVEVCPSGARELMGKSQSVDEVLSVIERDRVFYRQSGGGVTFSGGEALTQIDFLEALAERCWAGGISMALETSGLFAWDRCQALLARMDLIFLDIKHMDPLVHRRLTGVDNDAILQNANRMVRAGLPLVIRVPLIPTINDDEGNLRATAAFVSRRLSGVQGIEVLPYHTLGKGKYPALGLAYGLDHVAPPATADVARAREVFEENGIEVLYLGSTP